MRYSESPSKNKGACYKNGKNNFYAFDNKKSQENILPRNRRVNSKSIVLMRKAYKF